VMYFISPLDLVPDFIPVAGWLDDLVVSVTLLNRALDDIDPAIVDKYWLGEDKIYDFIKGVLDKGDKMVGTKIWNKIKKLFDEKTESKN
ncbi:MAG: YkvA family protein, partial [Clostridia bacterium]